MDWFILDSRFSRWHFEPNAYTRHVGDKLMILVLYVEYIILTGNDPHLIYEVKSIHRYQFEMTDLAHMHYFLAYRFFI